MDATKQLLSGVRNADFSRWPGPMPYGFGVLVRIPFLVQSFYTGPLVEKLGGSDISWLVGIAVTFALYYLLVRNRSVAPTETIYPDVEALDAQRR